MELIKDLKIAEDTVLMNARDLISLIRRITGNESSNLKQLIAILEELRNKAYENLNQIQHEAMILRAVQSLQVDDLIGNDVEWFWNPRQTGSYGEPDLRGMVNGNVIISAEVTSSENPVGTIDQRIKQTLQKLSAMPGKRIYFVRTESMEKRAIQKVSKNKFEVEVRRI